jgi:Rix1 complex component involved in 60S ribosome maturation
MHNAGRKRPSGSALVFYVAPPSYLSRKYPPTLIQKRTATSLLSLQDDLAPHSPTLLLFTASAQTHIFPEIQIDAIQFLDLYLDTFPDVVVCGWRDGKSHGKRILEGYLSILSAGTKLGEGGVCRLASSPLPDRSFI